MNSSMASRPRWLFSVPALCSPMGESLAGISGPTCPRCAALARRTSWAPRSLDHLRAVKPDITIVEMGTA